MIRFYTTRLSWSLSRAIAVRVSRAPEHAPPICRRLAPSATLMSSVGITASINPTAVDVTASAARRSAPAPTPLFNYRADNGAEPAAARRTDVPGARALINDNVHDARRAPRNGPLHASLVGSSISPHLSQNVRKFDPYNVFLFAFKPHYHESHSTDVVFGYRRRRTSLTQIVSQINLATFRLVKPVTNSSAGWTFNKKD
ncbi:hypothetical protein EVAR_87579_1 [Eumeta japonica]|uniref:Uncharacterized protein n=1 Tax=Eumeta variegata TaxID=151549 RepID=A0A4C1WQ18_EUMVA|nr:hypothetical protein EVAR_87579_1 [Eumeta japonica]